MPFERYLQQPQPSQSSAVDDGYSHSSQQIHQQSNIHPQYDAHDGQLDSTTFSRPIQFQMPQFMYAGPPTLALGGGAEVLPAGMFSSPAGMSSLAGNQWFQNSGFGKTGEPIYASSSSNDYANHAPLTIDPSAATASFQPYSSSPQSAVPPSPQQHQGPPPPPHSIVPSSVRQDGSGPMVVPHSLNQLLPHFGRSSTGRPPAPFTVPSALGLPVYSTSGFDLLSILARVATRPHPKIMLGPVDMSCSFVIVDTRRYDSPIVYASPSFYTLTGYPEHEVLGRNCRFLQAPDGNVGKGEKRQYTNSEAVAYMRKSLVADKECQTSMVNYRKNGSQFINLVSVIPVTGGVLNAPEESEEVVYHVGFQVDLTEQPSAILEKLKDGSYMVNYSTNFTLPPSSGLPPAGLVVGSQGFGSTVRDRRNASYASNAVSKDLRTLLADPAFYSSASPHSHSRAQIQSSSGDPSSPSSPTSPTNANDDSKPPTLQQHEHYDSNNPLSLLLLDSSPDFVVVLSLKGTFLYVAPSVKRVLGFEPEELAGKSVVDFCHKSDVVPLMRELKESSGGGIGAAQSESAGQQGQGQGQGQGQQGQSMFGGMWGAPAAAAGSLGMGAPKSVNFLFRAKTRGRVRWSFSVPASGKESETEGGEGEGDGKRKRKREGEDDGEEEGEYVWVECRGRLHIEPGKGRKAIILSARSREVPRLEWNAVGRAPIPAPASFLSPSSFPNAYRLSKRARNGGDEMAAEKDGEGRTVHAEGDGDEEGEKENEVWGIWSAGGTVLFMGAAVRDLLGWGVGEVIGMSVADLVGIGTSTPSAGSAAAIEWSGMSGYGGAAIATGVSRTQDVARQRREEERKKVEMALRKVVERSSSLPSSSSVSPVSGAYHSHPQHQHQYAPTNMTATTSGSNHGHGYGYRAQAESESVVARMKRKDGYEVDLEVVFYPGNDENAAAALRESASSSYPSLPSRSSSSIICQLRYPASSSFSPSASSSHPRHPSRFDPSLLALDRRGNIFEELETAKESSWQYELQQLKIANQRLAAEIEGMEGSVRGLERESEEVRRASVSASASGSGTHSNSNSNVNSNSNNNVGSGMGMGMGVAGPSSSSNLVNNGNSNSNNGTISLSMPIQLPIPVPNIPMGGSMQPGPVYGHPHGLSQPQPHAHSHAHGGMLQTSPTPNANTNAMPYSSYVGYEQSMRQHHQQQQAQAQMQQGWGIASHGHGHGGVPVAVSGWGPASGGGSKSSGMGGGMKRRWDDGGGV